MDTSGLETSEVDDLHGILNMSFHEFANSQVGELSICEGHHRITGIQATLYGRHEVGMLGRADYSPVEFLRIGSDKNCTEYILASNSFIKEVIVWGDEEHVAGVAFMNSKGDKTYYGSNFRGETEFPHTMFYLNDINRLVGAYGTE